MNYHIESENGKCKKMELVACKKCCFLCPFNKVCWETLSYVSLTFKIHYFQFSLKQAVLKTENE